MKYKQAYLYTIPIYLYRINHLHIMQMSLGKDFRTMEKAPTEVYFQCDTHIALTALL